MAAVAGVVGHGRDVRSLNRASVALGSGKRINTPWGVADHATDYGSGIVFYGTPSHGGFKVPAEMQRGMPEVLRLPGGWYEEDGEWARVALAFPDRFTAWERQLAEETVRNHSPEAWEAFYGRALTPGESHARDQKAWHDQHADRMVVVSATFAEGDRSRVVATARLGGRHGERAETFLVAAAEYERRGRFGFVIDPERHPRVGRDGNPSAEAEPAAALDRTGPRSP